MMITHLDTIKSRTNAVFDSVYKISITDIKHIELHLTFVVAQWLELHTRLREPGFESSVAVSNLGHFFRSTVL